MILTVSDRLILSVIMPSKDNIDRLILKKEIANLIKLTSDELELIKFKQDGDFVGWDKEKDPNKDFELTESQKTYIKSCLTKLNEKNELEFNMIELYKKLF